MKRYACLVLAGLITLLFVPRGFAQDQKPGGGEWGKRVAVKPDPAKVVVPARLQGWHFHGRFGYALFCHGGQRRERLGGHFRALVWGARSD